MNKNKNQNYMDKLITNVVMANKRNFESDPFGYSMLGKIRWETILELNGFLGEYQKTEENTSIPPDFFWLSQAEALSQAAIIIIKTDPQYNMPEQLIGKRQKLSLYRHPKLYGSLLIKLRRTPCQRNIIQRRNGLKFLVNKNHPAYRSQLFVESTT